jgi:hypothetical protein
MGDETANRLLSQLNDLQKRIKLVTRGLSATIHYKSMRHFCAIGSSSIGPLAVVSALGKS